MPGTIAAGTAAKVSVALAAAVAALVVRLSGDWNDTASGFVIGAGVFLGPCVAPATAPTMAISPNDRVAGKKRFVIGVTVMYLTGIVPPGARALPQWNFFWRTRTQHFALGTRQYS